ncbi:MAG: UPF0149 family protein [Pseudomonadota bacterium]
MGEVNMFQDCNVAAVRAFLASPERPEGTFNYEELLGYLFAIVCAPDEIPQGEWMEQIFDGQDPGVDDPQQAALFFEELDCLFGSLQAQVQEHQVKFPLALPAGVSVSDHFKTESPLHRWANGFVAGHTWLEEVWEDLPEDVDDDIGTCVMVLSFFANPELARSYHQEFGQPGETFEAMAEAVLADLEPAMADYADIGTTLRSDFSELD